MLDEQLGKTQFLAGDAFSYGDIPIGIMVWRFRELRPSGRRSRTSIAGTPRSQRARASSSMCRRSR